MECYVDSSWSNDPETCRSWFGYSIRLAGAASCYRSKLEPVVATSSRDAEAVAAVFAVKALLGFIIMSKELQVMAAEPLRVFVDNKATVDGAVSHKITKDSRHAAMRLAWLREIIQTDLIHMVHVKTDMNHADVHTKVLSGPKHRQARGELMGGELKKEVQLS